EDRVVVVALDRRLVAVMFTDMAGYTALLQADERLALDRRERYWDALERHHEAFGGTIVQRLGDALQLRQMARRAHRSCLPTCAGAAEPACQASCRCRGPQWHSR